MNKERIGLALCRCKIGASCVSCERWWPQLAQGVSTAGAGRPVPPEVGGGEWDGTLFRHAG